MWFPTIDDAEQDLTYFRVSIISMWFPTIDAEQDLTYFRVSIILMWFLPLMQNRILLILESR